MPGHSQLKKKLTGIEKRLDAHYGTPDRQKESDPLDILIGTILSQNTNDNNSYKAFLNLKESFRSWEDAAEAPRVKIENLIKIAGLGKQKSKAIKELLLYLKKEKGKINLDHHKDMEDGAILEEMTALNGIGLKTTSCLLLFGYGRNVCPVDTHVHRILNKMGVVKSSSPDKTYRLISEEIPDGRGYHLHTNLLKLGREYCRPTNPACGKCPVRKLCDYKEKQSETGEKRNNDRILLLDSI